MTRGQADRPAVAIRLLARHPDRAEQVASWLHTTWLEGVGVPFAHALHVVRQRMRRSALPVCLIALAMNGRTVGTVSLLTAKGRRARDAVLSGLYVAPDWRRRGVGTALCRHILIEARRLHVRRVQLYAQRAAKLYRRLGFRAVEDVFVEAGPSMVRCLHMTRQVA